MPRGYTVQTVEFGAFQNCNCFAPALNIQHEQFSVEFEPGLRRHIGFCKGQTLSNVQTMLSHHALTTCRVAQLYQPSGASHVSHVDIK
jgi:hypothetical protein